MRPYTRGFTLIELLLVVIIIGIVAAIALPRFTDAKNQAYGSTVASDLRTMVTAGELFYQDSSRYPAPRTCSPGATCFARYATSPDVSVRLFPGLTATRGYVAISRHAKAPREEGRCINIGDQDPAQVAAPATYYGAGTIDPGKPAGAQYVCHATQNFFP